MKSFYSCLLFWAMLLPMICSQQLHASGGRHKQGKKKFIQQELTQQKALGTDTSENLAHRTIKRSADFCATLSIPMRYFLLLTLLLGGITVLEDSNYMNNRVTYVNGDDFKTLCEAHQGISKPLQTFPGYLHNFPHPGVLSLATGISDPEELQVRLGAVHQEALKNNFISPQDTPERQNEILRPHFLQVYRSCAIDEKNFGNYIIDRTGYTLALEHLEKTLLPRQIDKLSAQEQITFLRETNGILTTGAKVKSPFRSQKAFMNRGIRLFDLKETLGKLYDDPKALDEYTDAIIQMTDNNLSPYLQENWRNMLAFLKSQGQAMALINRVYSEIKAPNNPSEIEIQLHQAFTHTTQMHSNPLEAAAYLHMQLVKIHSFDDGNGRAARVFAFSILAQAGIMPPIIFSNSEYTAAVNMALANDDYRYFYEYLTHAVDETEQIFCDPTKRAVFENLIDGLKSCELNCQETCDSYFEELGIKEKATA
jgi:prophage maintenance system killer protein